MTLQANVDAYQIVADYGSRTMDLQFLTAMNVFPDKGYPAVLTAAGTEGVAEVGFSIACGIQGMQNAQGVLGQRVLQR